MTDGQRVELAKLLTGAIDIVLEHGPAPGDADHRDRCETIALTLMHEATAALAAAFGIDVPEVMPAERMQEIAALLVRDARAYILTTGPAVVAAAQLDGILRPR